MQSQVTFNKVPEKVADKAPDTAREILVQNQVKFNRVPVKVPGSLSIKPNQIQQESGKESGGSREGFGAKSGHLQ